MKKHSKILILISGVVISFASVFLDREVFYFFNSVKSPFFDAIFGFTTNFFNVFVVLIMATAIFLLNEKKRKSVFPLWLSFFFSMAIAFILKLIFQRPRPLGDLYNLFNTISYSFPSMHAMAAFALLPILNKEFPKFKWLWFLSIFMFAFSRVYLNYHFLSDFVFGAFFGYFTGVFTIYANEKYKLFKFLK